MPQSRLYKYNLGRHWVHIFNNHIKVVENNLLRVPVSWMRISCFHFSKWMVRSCIRPCVTSKYRPKMYLSTCTYYTSVGLIYLWFPFMLWDETVLNYIKCWHVFKAAGWSTMVNDLPVRSTLKFKYDILCVNFFSVNKKSEYFSFRISVFS